MTNPIDPAAPSAETLANWVLVNELLLNDLSTIFTVLSGGKLEPGTPAELARQLLSSSVSPQALKDFRDYSVRLLPSVEGNAPKKEGSEIPAERGGEPLLNPRDPPSLLRVKGESLKNTVLDRKDTGSKAEIAVDLSREPLKNMAPDQKNNTRLNEQKITPPDQKDNATAIKTQTPLVQNPSSPLQRKNTPMVSMAETPRDPGLTIPQAMKKIVQEVLHSINLLSSIPAEKANALQLKIVHQKIAAIMEELVTPIKGNDETDFMSRDPSKNSIQSAVKKNGSKESISIPVFEKDPVTQKTLEERIIQPKSDSISQESGKQSRGSPPIQSLLVSPNKDAHPQVRPQVQEQTSIPGAPFSPPISSSSALRKEKKRRKLPWEREEYEEDEDQKNR